MKNGENRITEYLNNRAFEKLVPITGTFELTPVCNMACRMCYVRMGAAEQQAIAPLRSAAEWLELGRKARDAGMLYLLLTGGEVFLRPDLKEILEGLSRLGLLLSINTNGTLIDEKTVEWLKRSAPCRLNITLYGASNETYARLCGNPKGFDLVSHAIDLLKAAGFSVKLNLSLTPYNAGDLKAMLDFAGERGLLTQSTSYMFPPLRRDASSVGCNDRFTPQEAAFYAAYTELLKGGPENSLR